ncbi:MAG: fibronectin type domain protein, partial [Thermoleophilia bacterium]|nr:fibronectin type domain protein [Thermoleophilia bacterium]
TLAWNTGSDNVGVVSYRIYRTAPGATELLPAVTSPTISKPLTGLIEGTSYEFEIEAVDAAGLTSPRATLSFTTLDTTDPSAPGTPVVTNLAGHSLTLTWSASTDPTGIAGYRIRNFFTNTDSTTAGNVTTIDLTGLSDARQYTFGVYAIDSNDNESAVASVTTTTPDVTAPASITGFNVATIGASTATLAWNHSPDNATSSTYKIYRVDGGVSTQVATSIFSTVDLTGLAEGTTYTWEIDATDTAGNATARVSVYGRTGDATAPTAPGAPVVSANTGTSLTLTWSAATDAVGVTVYEIRQNGDVVGTVDGATLTYTITSGLIQGYSPSFRISAVDAANHRTFGAPTVATIPDTTSPLAVGNVRMMSINTTTATIMWNTTTDNVGVTNYNVFAVAGGIPTLVGTVGPTTTSLALSGLTEATEYTYRVIAGDFATNMSTPTEIAFSTVMSAPPTAPPFVFSSNVTGTGVDLTWTANGSGILEFDIFQDSDLIATISGADRSYVVTGLTDKTNYVFGVVTVDGIGRRSDPTTANVSTPDVSPPSTVTGFGATGVGPTWVNLSWNTSTDKTSVQRYTVWRLDAGGDVLVAEINAPGATNTTASNLDDSTGYTFAVEARDPFGNTTVRTLVTATTSDGTAPTAPGTPVVSALTHNSLNLTWDASTDLSAFTYEVSRNGASPVTGLTATTFAVTGLNPNADYTFTVRARDAANNLSSASTVSVTTPAAPDTTAPSSAYIYTQSVDGVNVTLAWLTANDNVAVTEYRVRRTAPTGGTAVVVPASSPRSLALPGLSDLVDYTYEIVAVDAANNISSAETVSFRTPDTSPPTTPGTPAVSNLQPRSLRLTWTASTDAGGVSYYFVTPSTFIGLDGMVWAPNTSLLVPNLQPDTDYTFTVKAYDPNGFVSPTSTVTVRTPVEPDTTPPGSPSNARTAAIGHTTATLAWSAPALVEGVTQYRISRTAPSAGTVEFAAAPATSFAVSGLTELTTYSYELVALDAAGNASLPQTITFRTTGDDTVVPTLPGPLSLGEYDGTVYVSWSTAGDNDEVAGYRVSVNGGAEEVLNNYWNTNHQVYGLSRDATHTVSVVAIDTAGNRSAALTGTIYIPAAYVAPPEPPVDPTPPPGPQPTPPPAAPSGVVAALTATTARISWNASSGASSYRVSVAGQARIVTGTSADFGPFAPKTVLAISVTAIGDGGESGAASLTVSTLADKVAPTAPGKLKAVSKKAKTLTLTWLPSKDDVKLLRYELQLTAKGAKAIKLKLAASAKTTTVAKLKSKAAYKMQLRAIDAAGNASKWVTVTAKPK